MLRLVARIALCLVGLFGGCVPPSELTSDRPVLEPVSSIFPLPAPQDSTDLRVDSLLFREEFLAALELQTNQLEAATRASTLSSERALDALFRLIAIFHASGDYDRAALLSELELALRSRLPYPARSKAHDRLAGLVRSLTMRARHEAADSRFDLAERHLREARDRLPKCSDPFGYIHSYVARTEGDLARRRADISEAVERYEEAAAAISSSAPSPSLERTYVNAWLAWHLIYSQRTEEAIPFIQESEQQLADMSLRDHSLSALTLHLRGDLEVEAKNWEEALEAYSDLTSAAMVWRRRCFPGTPRNGAVIDGPRNCAGVLLQLGRFEEALPIVLNGAGHRTAESLAMAEVQLSEPTCWREIRELRRAARVEEGRIQEAIEVLDGLEDFDGTAIVRFCRVFAQLKRAEAAALDRYELPEVDLPAIQRRLQPDEAHLGAVLPAVGSNWTGHRGRLLQLNWLYLVLPRKGPIWFPLGDRKIDDASGFRWRGHPVSVELQRASGWPMRIEPDPQLLNEARIAGAELFDALLPYLEGVRHLYVDASQLSLNLPLPVVVGPDGRFLDERFAITNVPCARAVRRSDEDFLHPESNVIIEWWGDSVTLSEREGVRSALPADWSFRDLPDSYFPRADRRDGGSPRKTNIVHLVGHFEGVGLLERRRLVTWRQDADSSNFRPVALALRDLDAVWEFENGLAVLSGCASAGGADRGEPMGLPQLFWEAGVRNMLGTSWSVEDGASTLFMARFYSSLVARMETRRSWRSITARDVAVAAQEARRSVREFRDSEGRQVFEHPVYWSGFTSWGIAGQ